MQIRKLKNLRRLEDELDRRGFDKYGIEPPIGLIIGTKILGDIEIIEEEEDDEL